MIKLKWSIFKNKTIKIKQEEIAINGKYLIEIWKLWDKGKLKIKSVILEAKILIV